MKSIAFLQAHLAPAVFAVFLLTSCVFTDSGFTDTKTVRVTILFPDYPADRPEATAWLLVHEKNGSPATQVLTKDTKLATLMFDKNRTAPVLLYPLNTEANVSFFKPAGCIYPFSLHATWDGGFGAQLLFDMLTNPGDKQSTTERFNWTRFQTEVADLCAKDNAFNPWEMDTEKLVSSIESGKFSKTKLKAAAKTVTVSGAEGSFFQTYIPAAVLTSESGSFKFGYNATGENIVFDGTAVFFIFPTGGTNYRLRTILGGL
jgi:hypothetical protein